MPSDGNGNAFGLQLSAKVVDQAGRTSQAADTVHHPKRVIERTSRARAQRDNGAQLSFVAARMVLVSSVRARGSFIGRHQMSDTSLRWASVSPSIYRCVVWIDR